MVTHPYEEFEDTALWNVIDVSITALVKNQDITEGTPRRYIVGYLCKAITEARFSQAPSPSVRKS